MTKWPANQRQSYLRSWTFSVFSCVWFWSEIIFFSASFSLDMTPMTISREKKQRKKNSENSTATKLSRSSKSDLAFLALIKPWYCPNPGSMIPTPSNSFAPEAKPAHQHIKKLQTTTTWLKWWNSYILQYIYLQLSTYPEGERVENQLSTLPVLLQTAVEDFLRRWLIWLGELLIPWVTKKMLDFLWMVISLKNVFIDLYRFIATDP